MTDNQQQQVKVEQIHNQLSSLAQAQNSDKVKIELDLELFPPIRWAPLNQTSQVDFGSERQPKQQYLKIANNSHKKYISAAKRVLFHLLAPTDAIYFQQKYDKFKTARSYFFVILAYVKWTRKIQINQFEALLNQQISAKIAECQKQTQKTQHENLRNFRQKEVLEMKYALEATHEFLHSSSQQAVKIMSRKGTDETTKTQNYRKMLRLVNILDNHFSKGEKESSLCDQEDMESSSELKIAAKDYLGSQQQQQTPQNSHCKAGEQAQERKVSAGQPSIFQNRKVSESISEILNVTDPFLIFNQDSKGEPLYPSQPTFKLRQDITDLLPA